MKDYFQPKTWIITMVMIIVAVFCSTVIVLLDDNYKVSEVKAAISFPNDGGSVWDKKHEIQIDPNYVSGSSLTNFPVYLHESNFHSDVFSVAQNGGCDLRFATDSYGLNKLAFEIVNFDTSADEAEMWVKIPSLSGSKTTSIWVWYGNSSATCYANNDIYGAHNVWGNDYELVTHDTKNDSTSNNNTSTEVGGVVIGGVDGKLGKATDFNGTSQGVHFGSIGLTRATAEPTSVSAWVNADSTGGARVIAGNRNGSGTGDLWKLQTYSDNWSFEYDPIVNMRRLSPQAVQANQWTFIEGVYDGSNVIIYINGVQAGITMGHNWVYIDQDRFSIGYSNYFNTEFFDGAIDEVRVSDVVKSADWVLTEYNNQNDPSSFAIPQEPMAELNFVCGTDIDYEGEIYQTVSIGNQCWFAKNLNIGDMVCTQFGDEDGDGDPLTCSINSNYDGVIEKYCYENMESNCTTYGGFYQWDEAMKYLGNNQGICPDNWHIPSDEDWHQLEYELFTGNCTDDRIGWQCHPAGTELKSGGSSGFNALLSGSLDNLGSYSNIGDYASYWSSSRYSDVESWTRYLSLSQSRAGRDYSGIEDSLTVRCLYDGVISTCVDNDSDGYGAYPESGTAKGCVYDGDDCDDTNSAINPGQTEICENGINDDCEGGDAACPETPLTCGGNQSEEACVAEGGGVVSVAGCTFCSLPSSCGNYSGWTQYNDWTDYDSRSCCGGDCLTDSCNGGQQCISDATCCTTGSGWQDDDYVGCGYKGVDVHYNSFYVGTLTPAECADTTCSAVCGGGSVDWSCGSWCKEFDPGPLSCAANKDNYGCIGNSASTGYSCLNLPSNATPYDADESTDLTSDLNWIYSATDTAVKCQYYCNNGYTYVDPYCAIEPSLNLSIDKIEIILGDSVELTWEVENTSVCAAAGYWSNNKDSSNGSHTQIITPTNPGEKNYSLECLGSDGVISIEKTVYLRVNHCVDDDGDGYGVYPDNNIDHGCIYDGDDCDDSDADVNPAAFDICGNGIDDDCSGGDEVCNCLDHNVSGYAWSGYDDDILPDYLKGAGWVSLSCKSDLYENEDYGVDIDPLTGNFSGHAWSYNLGWISFEESGTPNNNVVTNICDVTCDPDAGCTACLSGGNVYGWAKVLAQGDNGWIRLNDNNLADGIDYGVTINSNGEFEGWAWGSNSSDEGIGWISFNCVTDGSCGGSVDYKVEYYNPIVAPTITEPINPSSSNKCSSLQIDWTYPAYAGTPMGFRVYNSPPSVGDDLCDVGPAIRTCNDNTLTQSETRDYTVCAYNSTDTECSIPPVFGTTLSFCKILGVSGTGECDDPDLIHLNWVAQAVDYYLIKRCNETDSDCSNPLNFSLISSGDCIEPTSSSCIDTFVTKGEGYGYRYMVAGVEDNSPSPNVVGDWSEPTDVIVPCPERPTWTEVNPGDN